MEIEFDPEKDAVNVRKHGISLARAASFTALNVKPDERFAYGEARYRAWGVIDEHAYCLAFTIRAGRVRAISLRRVHAKEFDRNVP